MGDVRSDQSDTRYQIPDHPIRNGSLLLHANFSNYSRGVLNTDWHATREAEPKDYDFSKHPVRNLKWSTYKRLANVTDGSFPETTYQEYFNQIFLKPRFSELDRRRPLITLDTVKHAHIDRDSGDPNKEGYLSVPPRYFPDYKKYYLKTRPFAGFDPFEPEPEIPKDFPDKSAAYRKCHSQFTDTVDYRRPGWNTWQDESGLYANTHFKREVFVPRNPIPECLE